MAESDDSNEDGHKIISYEHQVTESVNYCSLESEITFISVYQYISIYNQLI